MLQRFAVASLLIVVAAAGCGDGSGPVAIPCLDGRGTPIVLAVGDYVTINPATDSGCVQFAPSTAAPDTAEYVLVPQSAAGTFGLSSSFQLRGAATTVVAAAAALAPPGGLLSGQSPTAAAFDGLLRSIGRTRAYGVPIPPPAPRAPSAVAPARVTPPTPGSVRSFKVCSTLTCSSFQTVAARARGVSQHIAVYIDTLAPTPGLDSADVDTLMQVFDTLLYPLDTAAFGGVSDIDTNGVAIVLMTGVVNKLVTKTQCTTSGYIAGFFFPGDLDPAFASQFNHGEIFYSIVADSAGKLSCAHSAASVKGNTPITFTHEFQHMINFVQHVLVHGANSEDGWLDEGLSKYAEELAGRAYLVAGDTDNFSNYAIGSVYDAYQYLNATGTSPLLIEFDNGTLAEVGASWLFTRYLVDQYGDSLPHKLASSALAGAANVATQTGHAFDTTVTRWALANWVSDLPGFTTPPELTYTTWHFRTTFASLHSQDATDFPLPYPLVPTVSAGAATNVSGVLRSGSGVFHRALHAPGAPGFALFFVRSGTTPLPAAVVPRLSVIRVR